MSNETTKTSKEVEVKILQPPKEFFRDFHTEKKRITGTQTLYLFEKVVISKRYGLCIKFLDVPYLCKGFPFFEAIKSIGVVKMAVMILIKNINWLKLLRRKSRNALINDFCKLADNSLGGYYLKDELLCPFARESKKFLTLFLSELKVNVMLADIFAFFVQYDDNYRYRLQDVISERRSNCNKQQSKKNNCFS
jgi:hypothetical protein